ncbi:MAG: c-type cytochrome [Pseudomonadales bacterium]|jgi:cytochrome c5
MTCRLVLIFLCLSLFGCSDSYDDPVPLSESELEEIRGYFQFARDISPQQNSQVMEKWARSCALCHVAGEGGAPRMGDSEAWAPRLSGGQASLFVHTIEGFNRMPPLGYCMDCENEDFAVMIEFMSGGTK